jgi:hypothetical protein
MASACPSGVPVQASGPAHARSVKTTRWPIARARLPCGLPRCDRRGVRSGVAAARAITSALCVGCLARRQSSCCTQPQTSAPPHHGTVEPRAGVITVRCAVVKWLGLRLMFRPATAMGGRRLIVGPRDGRVADERNGLSLLCGKWKFQCWLMPRSLSFFALWRRSTTCECGPLPGVLDLEWRIMSSRDNVAMNKATEPS